MERCYLELPSEARKDDILDFMRELADAGTEPHGTAGLEKVMQGASFEEALAACRAMAAEGVTREEWRFKNQAYLLVRERDRRIIGILGVRRDLSDLARRHIGHLGACLRPSEQRQGYGKLALYLGLREEAKLGEKEVIVGCATTNVPSAKTIRALGGEWVWQEYWEAHDEYDDFYRIDADEALARFAAVYGPYVAEAPGGGQAGALTKEVDA